jgi:hypothetical protein
LWGNTQWKKKNDPFDLSLPFTQLLPAKKYKYIKDLFICLKYLKMFVKKKLIYLIFCFINKLYVNRSWRSENVCFCFVCTKKLPGHSPLCQLINKLFMCVGFQYLKTKYNCIFMLVNHFLCTVDVKSWDKLFVILYELVLIKCTQTSHKTCFELFMSMIFFSCLR